MSRKSEAKKNYPDVSPSVVELLFADLPARGRYSTWAVRQVSEGHDLTKVFDVVSRFHEHRKRLPEGQKDLGEYPDPRAVSKTLDTLPDSKRGTRKKDPGYDLILRTSGVDFYHVRTHEGMMRLGRDTKWCVTSKDSWDVYVRDSLFVVAINRVFSKRGHFNRIVIQVTGLAQKNPKILDLRTMQEYSKGASRSYHRWRNRFGEVRYVLYDARDQTYDEEHSLTDPDESPGALEELLDYFSEREGVVREAVSLLITPASREEAEDYARRSAEVFRTLRHASSGKPLIALVEEIRSLGLFNPLSLLLHPRMRSARDCQAVYDTCTDEEKAALDDRNYVDFLRGGAVNVPEILDKAFGKCRSSLVKRLAAIAWDNPMLNKTSRKRFGAHFLKYVIGMDPDEVAEIPALYNEI